MKKLIYIVGGIILLILIIVTMGGGEKKETTQEQQLSQEQSQTLEEKQKEAIEKLLTTENESQQPIQEPEEPTCKPLQEICDGVDNDCDGFIDDNLTQQCGTSNVGACKFGIKTCQNGKWGNCIGAINPTTEICDQKDNDCNGQIDEGGVCKVPEPEPINLSGSGQQASQKFTLESGLSIFEMIHSGQSNFQIWLLDNSGQEIELLVNEIGSFNGSKAVGIEKSGNYILDISADGQWTVKIEQPRPTTASSIPKTFTGVGQQVSGFVTIPKGLTVFHMTHNGSSNFQVWLLDNNGQAMELLVNEIGSFDGSKAVGIPNTDIYLLDISADGNWSIIID